MSAAVGKPAPNFSIQAYSRARNNTDDQFQSVSLSDLRDRWLCLFFYPLDFTLVCPTELIQFNESLAEFEARDCGVLGASTDSIYSHKAWCDTHPELAKLRFSLLSDSTHEVSRSYGVLKEDAGIALRGTFLIDPHGVVRWSAVYDLGVGRNVHEILRVLEALQTDKFCACNWRPGDDTLS